MKTTGTAPLKALTADTGLALTADITFSYDRDQLAVLAGDLPLASMLAFDAPSTQQMRLTVTASAWQLDLDGATVFGSGMTLIRHRDGSCQYLHHATRARLSFEAKEVPTASVKVPGRWRVANHVGEIEVILEEPVGRRWIQKIRTGERFDHVELVKSFVEALLACAPQTSHYPIERVAELIADRGMPAEVTLTAEGSDAPLSRVTVTSIAIGAAPAADRDHAKGYRDLRDPANRTVWEKGGADLRRIEPRNLDDIRPCDQSAPPGPTVRMRRNSDSDPDPHTPRDGGSVGSSGKSAPPVLTTDAQVALRIEQRLLDDIQLTVNTIAAHLSGIETTGTDVVLPWLEQTVQSARRLDPFRLVGGSPTQKQTVPGTMLPALLHEDPGPGASADLTNGNLKACVARGGRGIIDRRAAASATSYLKLGGPPIPGPVFGALDSSDLTAVLTALTTGGGTGSLSVGVLTRFIAAVAFEDIGTLRFSLAKLLDQIDVNDLYLIQLTQLRITLSLPEPTTDDNGTPLEAPLLSGLRCRAGGTIEGAISLPLLSVRAQIGRTPTPLYWTLLIAGAPVVAAIMPQYAWVMPILWTITLFLTSDYAALKLDAQPLRAAFSVTFVPEPSSRALQPHVSVRLTGNISSSVLSYVPTGIHQLIDAAVLNFTNLFGITLSLLEGQLASALQQLLASLMGDGVPAGLLRLGVPVISGLAAGVDDDHVYLEATLGQPADPAIQIAPVPVSAGMEFDLDRDVAATFGAAGNAGRGRHYLSVSASINAVNQVAAVLWQRGEFSASVAPSSATALLPLLTAPFGGTISRIDTMHLSPPVFSLPPADPGGPRYYFDAVFPQFLVTVTIQGQPAWAFLYRVTCRGAFGLGTVPSGARFLSIAGIRNNVYEAMLDSTSVSAVLLDASKREKVTITVREAGDDPRHPQAIRTVRETFFETTDMSHNAPASWTQYGSGIFVLSNAGRDVGSIPRLDHVMANGNAPANPVGAVDAASQETYTLDGSDPDDAQPSVQGVTVPTFAQMPVDWGFGQGLTFAHLETTGALAMLSGMPNLNSFAIVDAILLYPHLAQLNL